MESAIPPHLRVARSRPARVPDDFVPAVPSFVEFGGSGVPARPAFVSRETDFWAHGINFGAQIQF